MNSELSVSTMGTAPYLPISIDDLPPPDTKRWVVRRKAQVVAAVLNGTISLDEACHRYSLSIDEFLSWQQLVDRHGLAGLRVTHLRDYRDRQRAQD